MNCLTGYIGLRGACSDSTPESGLYINDLPSISLKALSSFANEEQENFKGFFEEVERFSIQQIKGDIMVKKSKYFDKQILLATQNTGRYDVPYETVTASNHYKGVYLEMDDSYYGVIQLNHVQLYLSSAVDSTIYIYDANNGQLIDSKAFSGSVGSNIIQLNSKIFTYGQRVRLFVCYDASISNSINTYTYDKFPTYLISRAGKVSKSSSILESNIDFDNESAGLVLNFNVSCEIDGLICQNREFIKMPYWYLLGKNIMLQAMHNTRFNKYTMLGKEELKELHDYYADNYDESIKAALDSIELTTDGICFGCSKKRSFINQIP